MKIFSNSKLGMTGANFNSITLWAGVNIGLKVNVLLLMDIILCRLVRCSTVSFLSNDAQIRLFAMYFIDLGPISFPIVKTLS